MAMAAARCAVCSGAMVLTLVEADPTNAALELAPRMCRLRTQPNVRRGCWRQLTRARLRESPKSMDSQAAQKQSQSMLPLA
jgi:hypothetical protein